MGSIDVKTLSVAKKYTDQSVAGGGTIKGKNCVIKSKTAIEGGTRIVFAWYLGNGTEQTTTMDVMDGQPGTDGQDGAKGDTGLGIKAVSVNASNHLIVTYDDDTTEDAGEIKDVSTSFDKITDVDLSNLQDGQILKYNATAQKWENASAGSVDTNLVDLNDVDVENLTDGQIIVWDATAGRWVNADNAPSITIDPIPTSESENAVSSGGVYTALEDKADASDVPTKVSDLTNDSGFITNTVNNLVNYYLSSQTYTKSEVDSLISAITTLNIEVVQALPTTDISTTTIYLVPKSTAQASNTYDEYINTTGTSAGWELIGDTAIDLTNYVQKSQTAGLLKNDGTVDTVAKASQASVDAILNGANIDSFGDVENALAGKQNTISDLATIRSGASAGATAVQPNQLPGIATTQTAGLVKPDGTTITIAQDGTIAAVKDEGELFTGTLLAASWSNKTQTVSVTGLNSSDIGVVGVLDTAMSAQLAAAEGVTPVSVSNGTITFICEDVPTVDIPFGIVVTGTSSNGNIPDGGTTGQVLKKKSNTDLDVEWGDLPKPSYSTEEQIVGTWIDDKPLYQKTISFGALPNNASKSVAHNIVNLKNIIKIEAIAYGGSGSGRYWWSIPYAATGTITDQVMMYLDPTNINIVTKKDMTTSSAYITIQYTKTTD